MNTSNHLKKTPLWQLFLLNFITLGVWWAIWFLVQREALNKLHSREKMAKKRLLFSAIALTLSALWSLFSIIFVDLQVISIGLNGLIALTAIGAIINVATLVATIILTIEALRVRRILRDHFKEFLGQDVHISLLWTLILQIFYLQYKINRL